MNIDIPFVKASITPLFSRYFRNSCFFDSGVYKDAFDQLAEQWVKLYMIKDFIAFAVVLYIIVVIMRDETEVHTISWGWLVSCRITVIHFVSYIPDSLPFEIRKSWSIVKESTVEWWCFYVLLLIYNLQHTADSKQDASYRMPHSS